MLEMLSSWWWWVYTGVNYGRKLLHATAPRGRNARRENKLATRENVFIDKLAFASGFAYNSACQRN